MTSLRFLWLALLLGCLLGACGNSEEEPAADGGPTTQPGAMDAGELGADAGARSCGDNSRIGTNSEPGERKEFSRNRNPEEEAAREWQCQADTMDSGAATGDGGAQADGGVPLDPASAPDALSALGCRSDFQALASRTASGDSVKVIIDRDAPPGADGDFQVHFINSNRYGIHHEFAEKNLSVGAGLPLVPPLASFNQTEYTSPARRFLLGALTYYPSAELWAYELVPYDTSDSAMITAAFDHVVKNTWIGDQVVLHVNSERIAQVARELPMDIPTVDTGEVVSGGKYQALNLAKSLGRLRFIRAAELEDQTAYVDFRDIVVLDHVPNDISVTVGIITSEFQTPLAHINVLSQNRGTPNMALADAWEDVELRALEGAWVELEVRQDGYELAEVSQEAADAWWEDNRPPSVEVPDVDKQTTELRDAKKLVDLDLDSVYDAVKKATIAFGGKAAHYGALAHIEGLRVPKAFSIPVHYYFQFMEQNGFDAQVEALLAEPQFQDSPEYRDQQLELLRDEMKLAPVDPGFLGALTEKLETDYPGVRMRFRSSTNAEDLDGFTGAGLYTSKSGALEDPERPIEDAIRKVWASVWFFRAFEERRYRGIAHEDVGMALLVHRSFPEEEANGVALTNNPFDKSGLQPAFYVNVQQGDNSVVLPEPGTSTDAFLQFWDSPNQRVQYFSHSHLVDPDKNVLTDRQARELGRGLELIRSFFAEAYSSAPGQWWAMDVEFKFDQPWGEEEGCPLLFVKQARPFGR